MHKLLLFATLLVSNFAVAQKNNLLIRCSSDEAYQQQIANNPALKASYEAAAAQTLQLANNIVVQKGKAGGSVPLYIIPVVVHVVYNTAAQNISDTAIYTQIQRLNDDYRRINSDSGSTLSIFKSIVGDARIEFRLAVRDPSGNCTNGIIRKHTNTTSFSTNDNVKKNANGGDAAWPSNSYLNLWSCNLSNGTLGYAQFPGGAAATDGVVILYSAFGQKGVAASPYDMGRTATHEIGHWLNLYHTFQGGCAGMTANNCATSGDDCCDTPPVSSSNFGCPAASTNSCNETYLPRVDMTQNYMDYTDDACMNAFTFDQIARMQATLAGARASLANSMGLTPVVAATPIVSAKNDTVCNGSSVTITATGANTFFWTPYTGLNKNNGATVIASPTVTTVYTIYTTDTTNHCTNWTQDTITVLGSTKNLSVVPNSFCFGTHPVLTASGGNHYTWSPSTGISNIIHDTVTANFTSTSTYTITTKDTVSGIPCTASKSVVITVNLLPVFTLNKSAVCIGIPTPVVASGASTYSWSPSTGLNTTSGANVTATLNTPTTYTISGTNNATGCSGSSIVTIGINQLPNATFTANPTSNSVAFAATTSGLNYLWNFGDGNSSTNQTNTHNYTKDSTYKVCLTVTNSATGCSDSTCQNVTVKSLGIPSINFINNLSIVPNPATNKCLVSFNTITSGMLKIEISDLSGRNIQSEKNENANAGYHQFEINTSKWANGLYFLRIENNKNVVVKKIVKE